jgi:hypothetical protein
MERSRQLRISAGVCALWTLPQSHCVTDVVVGRHCGPGPLEDRTRKSHRRRPQHSEPTLKSGQIGRARLPLHGGTSPASTHRIAGNGSSFCGRDRVTALVIPARRATMRAIRLVPCWSSRLSEHLFAARSRVPSAAGLPARRWPGQGTPGRRRALPGAGRCSELSSPSGGPDGV